MSLNDALLSLYAHLNATGEPVTLSYDALAELGAEWNQALIDDCVKHGLLTSVAKPRALECVGCEQRCFQAVHYRGADESEAPDNKVQKNAVRPNAARPNETPHKTPTLRSAFMICDVPEKQAQMGRVWLSPERLQQWQSSAAHIAGVLQKHLGLKAGLDKQASIMRLGMMHGQQGRRWVVLHIQPLAIEINQTAVPIDEVLFAEGRYLQVDQARIDGLVNAKERKTGKAYTPSTATAEAAKQATQAMYQDWCDAYRRAKVKHPKKSKIWHSQQIAKQGIAKGRDAQTIYKHL